jgi:hypothetical protein
VGVTQVHHGGDRTDEMVQGQGVADLFNLCVYPIEPQEPLRWFGDWVPYFC